MNLPKGAGTVKTSGLGIGLNGIGHLVVIVLVPIVQFLAGMYVKQVGYFHISSSSANIVKKGHKKNRPLCAPAD